MYECKWVTAEEVFIRELQLNDLAHKSFELLLWFFWIPSSLLLSLYRKEHYFRRNFWDKVWFHSYLLQEGIWMKQNGTGGGVRAAWAWNAHRETWQTCLRGSVSAHVIAVSRDGPARGYALSPDTCDILSLSPSFPLSSSPCSLLLLTLAVSQNFLSYSLCLSSDWNQCTHAYKHTRYASTSKTSITGAQLHQRLEWSQVMLNLCSLEEISSLNVYHMYFTGLIRLALLCQSFK